jgi:predicted hotdog family 3-hydroxylacyl-ACP dehydratase
MSLLTTIVDYGDDWLSAEVHITPDSVFADDRGVPAWIGLEYMAQAIAAYGGREERERGGAPKIGFLLGTRKYLCDTDSFPFGQKLLIIVRPEMSAESGIQVFNCILQGQGLSASAVVNVFLPDDIEEFIENLRS